MRDAYYGKTLKVKRGRKMKETPKLKINKYITQFES